ncbi:hypothetical protein Q7P37_003277 [Cladosporium fusiforme]
MPNWKNIPHGNPHPSQSGLSAHYPASPDQSQVARTSSTVLRWLTPVVDHLIKATRQSRASSTKATDSPSSDASANFTSEIAYHGHRRREPDTKRRILMREMCQKLKEYDEAVLATAAIRRLDDPVDGAVESVRAFFEETNFLVSAEEPSFVKDKDSIEFKEDLFTFKVWDETAPSWVTEKLHLGKWVPFANSTTSDARFKSLQIDIESLKPLNLSFLDRKNVRRVMRAMITISGCLFLLVPILLMFFFNKDTAKLIIIVCSLLTFAAITAILTTAKNWEVVAATTAYAAVLVVFVGSNIG